MELKGKFSDCKASFGYEVIDGEKISNKEEQKIINNMRRLNARVKRWV